MQHGLQKLTAVFVYSAITELPAKEIAELCYRALQSSDQSQSKHEGKKTTQKGDKGFVMSAATF